ncbi:hypothetical protein [Methanotorris igneus]|uniref:Uncharacterized protein n=1 Tax=Methanotorris igneus (strain DSM 5666 / JCM 11834 / Kol 5) TaxID=880724 RepID=F6BBA5_METIK|nr:hypothetical protein [Methanotorris igneus]AEF97112.1 hypothetical protein Metig_1578 [Methanotorris igneus Kol 5]
MPLSEILEINLVIFDKMGKMLFRTEASGKLYAIKEKFECLIEKSEEINKTIFFEDEVLFVIPLHGVCPS